MFWLARLMRFWRPMPPTPTPAMFSRSLGGVKPRPSTWRGTKAAAAPLAAAVLRNLRRVRRFPWLPSFAWFLLFFFSSFISAGIASPMFFSADTLSLDSRCLATAQFCVECYRLAGVARSRKYSVHAIGLVVALKSRVASCGMEDETWEGSLSLPMVPAGHARGTYISQKRARRAATASPATYRKSPPRLGT